MFLKKQFTDFDEFSHLNVQWDLDFRQVEAGKSTSSLNLIDSGLVQIARVRMSKTVHQRGSVPAGRRTFSVLVNPSYEHQFMNNQVSGSKVLLFPKHRSWESVSPPGFDLLTISIDNALYNKVTRSFQFEKFERKLLNAKLATVHPHKLNQLKECVLSYLRPMHQRTASDSILANFNANIVDTMLLTMEDGESIKLPVLSPVRVEAVRKVEEYIHEHPHKNISLSELCEIAHVSPRTLQYAFLERFKITPKEYLRSIRLNKTRQELKAVSPATTNVQKIAENWGFTHRGQFAYDYWSMFGELPSETLKQKY